MKTICYISVIIGVIFLYSCAQISAPAGGNPDTTAPEVIDYDKDSMEDIMNKFKVTAAWNLPVIKNGKYFGFISKSRLLTAYRRKLINVTA